ncbi:MAG: hypothetical protein FWB80_11100 [Defluviitaleaceae bacterium]|nr:hypothetical protein [Defluviitaleaceae bacterium]
MLSTENQCDNCVKIQEEMKEYEIAVLFLLIVSFIGPIIGIMLGLFAGRKV